MLIPRLARLRSPTTLRENPLPESVADRLAAKAVIGAFADLARDGGLVPLSALEDHVARTSKHTVLTLVRQLEGDGLVEFTRHPRYGIALRLTGKGAVRLWLWDWPVETGSSVW